MIYTCSCSATVKVEHPGTKAVATLKMIASEQLKVLGNCSLQGFFCKPWAVSISEYLSPEYHPGTCDESFLKMLNNFQGPR